MQEQELDQMEDDLLLVQCLTALENSRKQQTTTTTNNEEIASQQSKSVVKSLVLSCPLSGSESQNPSQDIGTQDPMPSFQRNPTWDFDSFIDYNRDFDFSDDGDCPTGGRILTSLTNPAALPSPTSVVAAGGSGYYGLNSSQQQLIYSTQEGALTFPLRAHNHIERTTTWSERVKKLRFLGHRSSRSIMISEKEQSSNLQHLKNQSVRVLAYFYHMRLR
jgi:hypothetical protein